MLRASFIRVPAPGSPAWMTSDAHCLSAGLIRSYTSRSAPTMVGAEREVYERIKPALKQWASLVIHAGEPGAGTRMKLARNMLTFTSYAAACEAMKLAEAAGL